MKILIEKEADLKKYLVTEKDEAFIKCAERAIKGNVYNGPFYLIPKYADLLICIPFDGINIFIAGGEVKFEGDGQVTNSFIYNRLIEEF